MIMKFAFVKWLPLAVVTSGLSLLIHNHISSSAPVGMYWFLMMAITFGLYLFGEHRHSKAMAARATATVPH